MTASSNNTCFLLGGGPSLEGFDYSLLDGKVTIGVNKTFKQYHPTMLYCMDRRFFVYIHSDKSQKINGDECLLEEWLACPSKKYFIASNTAGNNTSKFFKGEPIIVIPRLPNKCISMDIKKGIYPGNNSGFGAMMLAIALGYKTIYLLGFDFKIAGKKTHCHNGYKNQKLDNQQRHLDTFRRLFDSFSVDLKNAGINVINLNPNSALNSYEKLPYENILKRSD